MVNKSIKAILIALSAFANGAILANAKASDGGVAQTKPTTVFCYTTGGMTATGGGTCTCIVSGDTIQTGRARGDVVRLKGSSKGNLSTTKSGKIQIPELGQVHEYTYGNITLVIGSFGLKDQSINPKVDKMMSRIIKEAAQNNPWAETMVWFGRRLAKSTEVVEIGETYTSSTDLSNLFVDYTPKSANEFSIKTPEIQNPQGKAIREQYIIDLNPIAKTRS